MNENVRFEAQWHPLKKTDDTNDVGAVVVDDDIEGFWSSSWFRTTIAHYD